MKQSQEIALIQNKFLSIIKANHDLSDDARIFYNKSTLRLTTKGKGYACKHYQHWKFTLPQKLTTGQILNLCRKMKYPYWYLGKHMILFTEQDAFMAKLAGAENWLDAK